MREAIKTALAALVGGWAVYVFVRAVLALGS